MNFSPDGRERLGLCTFEHWLRIWCSGNSCYILFAVKIANSFLPDSDKPSPVQEFPMREWSLKLHIVDEDGNERPADVFTKVVYNLHPTFENPTQSELFLSMV
jgi:hypothetical protein